MTSTFKDHRPTVPYSQEVKTGQAVYTKFTLALYDFFVLGLSNQLDREMPYPPIFLSMTTATFPETIWTSEWEPDMFWIIASFPRRPRGSASWT